MGGCGQGLLCLWHFPTHGFELGNLVIYSFLVLGNSKLYVTSFFEYPAVISFKENVKRWWRWVVTWFGMQFATTPITSGCRGVPHQNYYITWILIIWWCCYWYPVFPTGFVFWEPTISFPLPFPRFFYPACFGRLDAALLLNWVQSYLPNFLEYLTTSSVPDNERVLKLN